MGGCAGYFVLLVLAGCFQENTTIILHAGCKPVGRSSSVRTKSLRY